MEYSELVRLYISKRSRRRHPAIAEMADAKSRRVTPHNSDNASALNSAEQRTYNTSPATHPLEPPPLHSESADIADASSNRSRYDTGTRVEVTTHTITASYSYANSIYTARISANCSDSESSEAYSSGDDSSEGMDGSTYRITVRRSSSESSISDA